VETSGISVSFVSIPSFQYSNSPLVDAFVASMETRKLLVDRPQQPSGSNRLPPAAATVQAISCGVRS
jgi:hypothetical protein